MRGFPKIWRASHFPNSARYSGKLYKRKKNNKKMQKSLVIFPERTIISFAKYRKNIMFLQGALAQLGARNIRIVEARGSNPLYSILKMPKRPHLRFPPLIWSFLYAVFLFLLSCCFSKFLRHQLFIRRPLCKLSRLL